MKSFLRACCAAATALALSLPASATTLSFDELGSPGGVFGTGGLDGMYQGFDLSPSGGGSWEVADVGGALGIMLPGTGSNIESASIRGTAPFTFEKAVFINPDPVNTSDIWLQIIGKDGSATWLAPATDQLFSGPPTLSLSRYSLSSDGFISTFSNPFPTQEIMELKIYGRPGSFIVDDIALLYPYGSGGSGSGTGGGTGGSGSGGTGSGSGTGGTGGLPLGDGVVTPIPEPSTYAMLLAGLGCIVLVARRRQMQG